MRVPPSFSEWFEQLLLVFLTDSSSTVNDFNFEHVLVRLGEEQDLNESLISELESIGNKVKNDLLQSLLVTHNFYVLATVPSKIDL